MKYLVLLLFNSYLLVSISAQTKELTLKGIMTDRSFSPERLSQMQWAKRSSTFFYVKAVISQQLILQEIQRKLLHWKF